MGRFGTLSHGQEDFLRRTQGVRERGVKKETKDLGPGNFKNMIVIN